MHTVLMVQGSCTTRRKDFGIAEGRGGVAGGHAGQGIRRGLVHPSGVCLLRVKLVRAAMANRQESFGGGQGHSKERLCLELACPNQVWVEKGW